MSGQVLRVAWYRLLAGIASRRTGYAGLALVVGLAGGVALGSAAAAGRTESSFPVFLASTNPSNLTVRYASDGYPRAAHLDGNGRARVQPASRAAGREL